MKKIFSAIFTTLLFTSLLYSLINAESFPYNESSIDPVQKNFEEMKEVDKNLRDDFNIKKHKTISWYIQTVLSYFLSLTAIIATLVLLYWLVQVINPQSDEAFQKALKYIKWAVIALIVIWLSWLFVMFVFHIYKQTL